MRYFKYEEVNSELRALCPGIDQPGQVVEWRNKRYLIAWHTGLGVYIKRVSKADCGKDKVKPS